LAWVVIDGNGEVLFGSPLAETAMSPASALKTLCSGAAFGLLGPDFRFETAILTSREIAADGGLDGDLVIRGGGDPTLSQADLKRMAGALVAAGLKTLRGRVLADASVFPEHPMSDHWNWGDIGNAYGAGAFGLNINHNRFRVRFDPGSAVAEPATLLGADPAIPWIEWRNRVRTGPSGSGDSVVVYSEPYGTTVTLRGTVPAGEKGFVVRAAIPDPPRLAAWMLEQLLVEAGVKIQAASRPAGRAMREPQVLHRHLSGTVEEIVTSLHRSSDNLEAQSLFLRIGSERKMAPTQAVISYWEDLGVGFSGLRLLDGSGLARANMIRPVDLARVNLAARRAPHGDRFIGTLYAADGGTLRSKNGAMSGVRTEVGFVLRPDGSEWTFAMMANGLQPEADFRAWRARLLAAMK
jgi:D-alanyl-D-alanine carboxypeptidase/D-alanyl-D-alanine-endopeptidase (penicillin-binding protein 4)